MSALNKFKITTFIRSQLLSDPKIKAMIDDKVFPLFAPEDTKEDFIIYQRDAYNKKRNRMGVHEQECFVYINVVSEDYDRSQELATLIDECLDGTYSNPNMTIWLEDSSEDFDKGKYYQVLLYAIK